MELKYILTVVMASLLTLSCSKKDSICGTWFEAKITESAELILNEDGTCLLSLDDNFTEGIDREIRGKWNGQETRISCILTMKANIILEIQLNLIY